VMLGNLKREIDQIAKDKGIDSKEITGALEEAMRQAARRRYGQEKEIEARYNDEIGEVELFEFREVVEEITDPEAQILIADARRDTWHIQTIALSGRITPMRRGSTSELPAGDLLTPTNFRRWSALPASVSSVAYAPAEIFNRLGDADLFTPSEAPDAFQHTAPDYQKWSAQLHSADTAARN